MRPSKSSKLEKDEKELLPNNYQFNGNNKENVEEEKYCICNRVSFGDMIGCDNGFVKLLIIILFIFCSV